MSRGRLALLALVVALTIPVGAQKPQLGYYRFPALWGDTIVFTAEGDLWRVSASGGVAERLTTHPAEESRPAISPDGKLLAFSASYEGPVEVYTLPLEGGLPVRQTHDASRASVVGWMPDGEILYATQRYSTLPNTQLVRLNPRTGARAVIPLAQASDGAYDTKGATLFFTRLPFQGSHTRRYKGGTAQNLWKYTGPEAEAVPLTADYPGTSKTPMPWQGRVYFVSDRDGTMNLWSMDERGGDLGQHTKHRDFDVQSPSLSRGRIVYQLGADLRLFDIATSADRPVPITLVSDFDQLRERWVKTAVDWITSAHLSPDGDRVALTARGQVFVAPAQQGRIVEATRNKLVRYRNARFFPDGQSVLSLSDESGEVEFWRIPANGVGPSSKLTSDAKVLRFDGLPSPDGNFIAHHDKDQQLWVFDVAMRHPSLKHTAIAASLSLLVASFLLFGTTPASSQSKPTTPQGIPQQIAALEQRVAALGQQLGTFGQQLNMFDQRLGTLGPSSGTAKGLRVVDANGSEVGPMISRSEVVRKFGNLSLALFVGPSGFTEIPPLFYNDQSNCSGSRYVTDPPDIIRQAFVVDKTAYYGDGNPQLVWVAAYEYVFASGNSCVEIAPPVQQAVSKVERSDLSGFVRPFTVRYDQ
jgi:Tol biopolymer transport system component